jgi:organic hydroperoxide reductase OsmC/OhrA
VLKDATENEKRWKDQFLTLVRAKNLDKGEYSGIGLSTSDSFDISNVEIAKKEKIAVPMIESANVKVGILRLKELIAKGILKADEVEFSTSPDLEKLEVLMQEKKIVCNYTRSYRTTVSKQ